MSEITPRGITADRNAKALTISWSDGHTSVYPYGLLRRACPCAECRGDQENAVPEAEPDLLNLPVIDARATIIQAVELVGNYALNISWEDGHSFGIYNWEYLRSLEGQ